jgi:hypothetical protein
VKRGAKIWLGAGIVAIAIVIALAVWPKSATRSAISAKEAAPVPVTAAEVSRKDVPIVGRSAPVSGRPRSG